MKPIEFSGPNFTASLTSLHMTPFVVKKGLTDYKHNHRRETRRKQIYFRLVDLEWNISVQRDSPNRGQLRQVAEIVRTLNYLKCDVVREKKSCFPGCP